MARALRNRRPLSSDLARQVLSIYRKTPQSESGPNRLIVEGDRLVLFGPHREATLTRAHPISAGLGMGSMLLGNSHAGHLDLPRTGRCQEARLGEAGWPGSPARCT